MADNSVRLKIPPKVLDEFRPSSGRRSRAQVSQNQESSVTVLSDQDLQVYIEDIPTNLPENDLEILIQTRLEATQHLKIKDIRCYLKLGVAVIRLINEEDKVFLVSNLETMVLYPKTNTIINFIGEIELDSYVVVDRKIS
ncbi:unnamed protein product [Rotaria magnacalcarata]|nr:unnamed protein product [Rotaria magnacalcarata]CAF5066932.1 unnamed protein product [Rotaria magnacalcarata]